MPARKPGSDLPQPASASETKAIAVAQTRRDTRCSPGKKERAGAKLARPFFVCNRLGAACDVADYAASSKSSSVTTGPESWPFAETSRSTNSMIAIGEASDARMPALMMRV